MGRLGRLGIAGAAVAALPLTTGCQTRIGEAASVGSHQIATSQLTSVTERSVAAAAASGNPVPANQAGQVQRNVLNLLVQVVLLRDVGAARGLTVSQSDLNAERATEATAAGGDAALVKQLAASGLSATDIPLLVERSVIITKLQAAFRATDTAAFTKDLTAAAKQIKIRINPRFGSWAPKTLTIVGAANTLSSTVTKK